MSISPLSQVSPTLLLWPHKFLQASSKHRRLTCPGHLPAPSAPILGESVPLPGSRTPPGTQIAGLSLHSVLTPSIQALSKCLFCCYPIFASELCLTHASPLLAVAPGQAGSPAGWESSDEESISGPQCHPALSSLWSLHTALHPTDIPSSSVFTSSRSAGAQSQSRFGTCQDDRGWEQCQKARPRARILAGVPSYLPQRQGSQTTLAQPAPGLKMLLNTAGSSSIVIRLLLDGGRWGATWNKKFVRLLLLPGTPPTNPEL